MTPTTDSPRVGLSEAERAILESLPCRRKPKLKGKPLTDAERRLMIGFEAAIRKYGNPSVREIAECSGPGWWQSNTHQYLRRLAEKGYVLLPKSKGRTRGMRLLMRESEAA